MKACLMKVNYDPKFTSPHQLRAMDSFMLAREAYGPGVAINQSKSHPGAYGREDRQGDEYMFRKRVTKPKINAEFTTAKSNKQDKQPDKENCKKEEPKINTIIRATKPRSFSGGPRLQDNRTDQHKEGIAKAHSSLKLQPIKGFDGKDHLQRLLQGPYTEKLVVKKHSSPPLYNRKHGFYAQRSVDSMTKASSAYDSSFPAMYHRSKTMPSVASTIESLPSHITKIKTPAILELERRARREADLAMKSRLLANSESSKELTWWKIKQRAKRLTRAALKENKVFTIIGPYHSLRSALRRRGWVEKFHNAPLPCELSPKMIRKRLPSEHRSETVINYDLCDDDDSWKAVLNEHRSPPWEEENGLYGIMSHLVRNCIPSFIFTVRSVDVDSRTMKNGQLVNHYGKARSFTTKVGLCQNLRNLFWYEKEDSDTFYPRAYMISEEEEKEAFIVDYRISACFGFIKYFAMKYKHLTEKSPHDLQAMQAQEPDIGTQGEEVAQNRNSLDYIVPTGDSTDENVAQLNENSSNNKDGKKKGNKGGKKTYKKVKAEVKSGGTISVKILETALQQCEVWLKSKEHEDIDLKKAERNSLHLSDAEWDRFIGFYYQFIHYNAEISPISPIMVDQCEDLLNKAKEYNPQQLIDGHRNVWILKPGGKSRGRGIQCSDRLGIILQKLADSDESQFIAQKYIERPFLVYKTKFDIRQWFLVTDFNPLTIWFYKHNYLRFCSQEYTLENFHESIHLSNNSVQKHYSNCADRSNKLPEDNMWTSEEFDKWLKNTGHGDVWHSSVIPGIKKALLCSLLCCQEFVECRKSAFELYGADFMLGEDLSPWLIEINSSPSMARNTRATVKLVDMVMEDTIKVVLDRRLDKNADTGAFQLLYKAPAMTEPPNCDASFVIQGRKIRKRNHRR